MDADYYFSGGVQLAQGKGFSEPYLWNYFDPSNTGRLKDLDLLLLTQGWRDFRWKYNGLEYPPEYGFSVSGSVRKRLSDAPVENATVTIGFLNDRKPLIDYLPTDSTGHFVFEDIDFSGNATIIALTTNIIKYFNSTFFIYRK